MSACIVGTSKCRLDVWKPKIYNATADPPVWYVPAKWVTCETNDDYTTNQRRSNAVTFAEIHDEIGAPRSAKITLADRCQDFRDTSGTYTYVYNDSDGNAAYTAGIAKKHGVLNNFFHEFAYVRLVELESHMVLFSGRIYKINKKYETSTGSTIELECFDGLRELADLSPRNLGRAFEFSVGAAGGSDPLRRSDVVQGILNVGFNYLASRPPGGSTKKNITPVITVLNTGNMLSSDAATAAGQNSYSRFERSEEALPPKNGVPPKVLWRPDKTGAPNLLSEITRFAIAEPHENETADDQFGYDFFVDSNYGSANLAANTAPRSPHFNYFKRGNRLTDYSSGTGLPATYGLTVNMPIRGQISIAVGHKTVGSDIQYATKVMQGGAFDFESPEDELFTECILTYNAEKEVNEDGQTNGEGSVKTRSVQTEKTFEIIYVNHLSGQFTYAGKNFSDEFKTTTASTPGVDSAEYLYAHNAAGARQNSGNPVARVQFQSHVGASSTTADFRYLLLSDLDKLSGFPTSTYGSGEAYVLLKNSNSSVSCRFYPQETTDVEKGRPSQVWGIRKRLTITQMNIPEPDELRKLVATRLAQASIPIRRGRYQVSKAPYYWIDGLVKDRTSGSPGDRIRVKNMTGSAAIWLTNYGVREGMLVHKMTTDHAGIAQANNNDVYGYIHSMTSDAHIDVDLTESVAFEEDDPIRIFIPIRAGDVIRVDNIIADVLGDHLITEVDYSEYPNPVTQFQSIGKNEVRGGPVKKGTILSKLVATNDKEESRHNIGTPRSIQFASFDGTFGYSSSNTITWTTGNLTTSDGTTYQITNSTTSDTNHGLGSSGMTGTNKYILYVDPVGENPSDNAAAGTADVYHIKTIISTGYKQDADNIKIGSALAGVNQASFFKGIDVDAAPGKVEGTETIHNESMTSALLKKGARPWTTTLQINGTAFNAISWSAATLTFANGDTVTINAGSETSIAADTHYMYLNGVSGSVTPLLTTTHGTAIGDAKILLATITVSSTTDGNKPTIFPFNGKKPTLSAVVLAGDLILADHIRTNTISSDRFTATARTEITKTYVQSATPSSPVPTENDLWFDTGEDPVVIKVYESGSWVTRNQNLPEGESGAFVTVITGSSTVPTASTPSAPSDGYPQAAGDYVVNTTTSQRWVWDLSVSGSNKWKGIIESDAINNANTTIDGGLINTQKIILQDGGSSNTIFATGGTVGTGDISTRSEPAISSARIEMDYLGITGYSSSGTSNKEFYILTNTGKGYFANGAITLDCDGINLDNVVENGTGANNKFIQFTKTGESASSSFFIQRYVTSSEDRLIIGKGGGDIVQISGHLYGMNISQSNLGSLATPWGKLYVTGGTGDGIYIGDRLLRNNSGTLEWNGSSVGTTYSAGTGLSLSGTTFNVDSHNHSGVYANASHGSHGGDPDQNLWATFNLSSNGGSNSGSASTASSTTDTFLFIAGSGVTLTGGTDSLTIAASSSGGGYFTGNAGSNNRFAYYSGGDELYSSNTASTPATVYSKGGVFQCYVTSLYFYNLSPGGGDEVVVSSSGLVSKSTSSKRYKENIIDLAVDTSKVYDLVPRTFKWKDMEQAVLDENGPTDVRETVIGPTDFGLIAEEVHEVLPELVRYNEKNEPNAVNYKTIAVLLLEEMKKLKTRIEVLEGN